MIQRTPTKTTASERCSAIHFLRWKAKASLKLEEARTKPTASQVLAADDAALSKSIEKYRKLFRDVGWFHPVQLGKKTPVLPYRSFQALSALNAFGPVLIHPSVQLPRPSRGRPQPSALAQPPGKT